jgi:hypothetical protein
MWLSNIFSRPSKKVDLTEFSLLTSELTDDPPVYVVEVPKIPRDDLPAYVIEVLDTDIKVEPELELDLMTILRIAQEYRIQGNSDKEKHHLCRIIELAPTDLPDDREIRGNTAYRLSQLYKAESVPILHEYFVDMASNFHNASAMYERMEYYLSSDDDYKFNKTMNIIVTCIALNIPIDNYFDKVLHTCESSDSMDGNHIILLRLLNILNTMTTSNRIQEFRLRLANTNIDKYNYYANVISTCDIHWIEIRGQNCKIFNMLPGDYDINKMIPIILSYHKKRIDDAVALFIIDKNYDGIKLVSDFYLKSLNDSDEYNRFCIISEKLKQ